MSEQNVPQNQDDQIIEAQEIAPEDLEEVAGGGNNNCNFICFDEVDG